MGSNPIGGATCRHHPIGRMIGLYPINIGSNPIDGLNKKGDKMEQTNGIEVYSSIIFVINASMAFLITGDFIISLILGIIFTKIIFAYDIENDGL